MNKIKKHLQCSRISRSLFFGWSRAEDYINDNSTVLFFAAFTAIGSAATIYVPDDYGTIQGAVDAAGSGDTIIVRDGTYTEDVNVNKSLTIRSKNGSASTTVQASNSNDHVFEITADYVNISGFNVTGAT